MRRYKFGKVLMLVKLDYRQHLSWDIETNKNISYTWIKEYINIKNNTSLIKRAIRIEVITIINCYQNGDNQSYQFSYNR